MEQGHAECHFCGRAFDNRQAVRAHLKWCKSYQAGEPKGHPLGNSAAYEGTKPSERSVERFVSSPHVRRQMVPEEARAKIYPFPLEEIHPAEQAEVGEGSRNLLLRSALEDAKEAQRLERIKHARIETGKRYAEERLSGTLFLNPWDRYTATREVEEALIRELTGEESPANAERIAEEVLTPWFRKEARHKKEQQQKKTEERRCERKRELIEYGETCAREAAVEEGLSPMDKMIFRLKVQRELENELDGNETEEDVETLVNEILDEKLEEGE